MWHHGGKNALGIKINGRWAVFYHPGDINDAWKTGRSGVDRRMADRTLELGYNVVSYAYTHYLNATQK